jgi:hypothetical protein
MLRLRYNCAAIAVRFQRNPATILLVHCNCVAIRNEMLRSRCDYAVIVLQLNYDCATLSLRICCDFAAIALRFRCDCAEIELRSRRDRAGITLRLRCDCATSNYPLIVLQLNYDRVKNALRMRYDCATNSLRLRYDFAVI